MSSEQKVILGIVSMRQLIYILAGGSVAYSIIQFVWLLTGMFPFPIRIIACVLSITPVAAIVIPLGFIKKRKYGMYLDYYLLVKIGEKTQLGTWIKGKKPEVWMEES